MFLAAGNEVAPVVALMAMVLGGVVLVSLLLLRFKQSLLVGYFTCGVVFANTGAFSWLGADPEHAVAGLSELGVVLLMFTLGIEFSIRELLHLRRVVLGGGGMQMLVTTLLAMAVCYLLGVSGSTLLVVGFALALSSTAVSIKSFQDLGQPDTPGARMALGIAIFQDLAVIVFMVVLPSLVGDGAGGAMPIVWSLLKGVLFLALCWGLSRVGVPHLLHAVALSRSRELFTVTVIALCAGIAWGANWFGLSLALGAFATGLVVSESIYSHRVLADILPFKDLFLTVFFVSVGLMIDLSVVRESWWIIALGVATILLIKGLVIIAIGRKMGLRLRQALLAGAALSSSGEFSLVLMNRAADLGGLPSQLEQMLLACTAVSMALVPGLMRSMIPLSSKLEARGWCKPKSTNEALTNHADADTLRDHVVICGYGPVGQRVHEAMKRASIQVVVLEMNADTVRDLHQRGVRVMFADATKEDTMQLAKVDKARAIAFTFPEPRLACEGVIAARQLNPGIVTYARAKFSAEVEMLKKEGVHHIFHDEATSGDAMVQAVLGCYSVEM
ncbi:cation:proton antiporter [Verrucomicrobiaceae bacterium 5K15]|uniref:Cation:proton antiporter n=1 Tax=Oceaniferula flava TaxID=2800421 RepID=A0AAE2V8X4_9BACT|nr:cation:proton antiporter [Oceaniferula flavus]MBK1854218.1 cation:proton antiporter [Oceaniferula flavus]MBM1135524.1 cation:proton antiporter [Oceaniferula flavus]